MIEATPQEAALLFDKWRSEGTEVLCTSRLIGWSFVAGGFVLDLSTERAVIGLKDRWAVTIPFGTDGVFWGYSDDEMGALAIALPRRFFVAELSAPFPDTTREVLFIGPAK
jgi:hypothetical protein